MTTDTASRAEYLSAGERDALNTWWRAANSLWGGQISLPATPLLREPLRPEHIKPRLLGHWGTTPGLNFLYVHMNRAIRTRGLNAIFVTGPGHGGPGLVASTYLDGTYSEVYHHIGRDEEGIRRLFRQFSFPGGLDQRGRRAGLRAGARLWRGVRQPGSARRLRRRRRRGRDRAARGELAL